MSIDDMFSRRAFLGYSVGAAAFFVPVEVPTQENKDKPKLFTETPVTAKQRDAFEKMRKMYAQFAKLDAKQQEQSSPAFRKAFATYWDGVTKETNLIYDVAANPEANIGAWYAWNDLAQRPTLQKLIQNGTPVPIAMAEKDTERAVKDDRYTLLYNGVPGKAAKQTALVLGDNILALESADEAWSVLDFATAYALEAEQGIVAGGIRGKYSTDRSHLWQIFGKKEYTHQAGAYAAQLTNIFNGTRKVSDAFKDKAHSRYMDRRSACVNGKMIMEKSIEEATLRNAKPLIASYEELRDFFGNRVTELDASLEAAKLKQKTSKK